MFRPSVVGCGGTERSLSGRPPSSDASAKGGVDRTGLQTLGFFLRLRGGPPLVEHRKMADETLERMDVGWRSYGTQRARPRRSLRPARMRRDRRPSRAKGRTSRGAVFMRAPRRRVQPQMELFRGMTRGATPARRRRRRAEATARRAITVGGPATAAAAATRCGVEVLDPRRTPVSRRSRPRLSASPGHYPTPPRGREAACRFPPSGRLRCSERRGAAAAMSVSREHEGAATWAHGSGDRVMGTPRRSARG